MVTSEVIMTDRAGLGFGEEAAPIGPMTGDVRGWGGSIPSYSITWRNIDRHLAALVTPGASNTTLKVLLHNFNEQPMNAEMLLWRLDVGGEYDLTMGPDADGDDVADSIETRFTFTHEHRGDPVTITIPSRKTMALGIRQTKKGHNNFIVPDLAMSPQDITVKDGAVEVTVHNIGSKDSGAFEVALYEGDAAAGKPIGTKKVDELKAPNDLKARTVVVRFKCDTKKLKGMALTAVADPADEIYELTEVNNSVSSNL